MAPSVQNQYREYLWGMILITIVTFGVGSWLLITYVAFIPSAPENFRRIEGVYASSEGYTGGKAPYWDIKLEGDNQKYRIAKPSYSYFAINSFLDETTPGDVIVLTLDKQGPDRSRISRNPINFVYGLDTPRKQCLSLQSYLDWEISDRKVTPWLVGFLFSSSALFIWMCAKLRQAKNQKMQA